MRDNKNYKLENVSHHTTDALHFIFSSIAQSQPEAKALIYKNRTITYSELDLTSNSVANELINRGAGLGTYIPILIPRSPELIISLLAVLKTGAAYALLDPSWPRKKLEEIIFALKPPFLITNISSNIDENLNTFNPFKENLSFLENFNSSLVSSDSPSSVFFTSGTSGQPKGVVSPHCGTIRLFRGKSFTNFSSKTVIPLAASLPWDAFSLELWGGLLNGGTCWVLDEPYLSSESLRKGIQYHGVNTIWMTSSLLNMIIEEDIESLTGLEQLMTGGERLSVNHIKKFIENHPNIKIINGYGPVESTIFATTHTISLQDCMEPSGIPIGSPVPGTQVYVVDDKENLCREGETGEIHITGEGLAIGYLNSIKLTNEKFKEINIKGIRTRAYKTGDMGFWKDNLLFFVGRKDRQIKIRGHRIELADVENQITKLLPEVSSCRVIAKKDSSDISHEIIAFCIPSKKGDLLENSLSFLQVNMVHYQCPDLIVPVETFPLTPQGKLDEHALLEQIPRPNFYFSEVDHSINFDSPLQALVYKSFSEVLNKTSFSIDASVKKLGGTSLDIGRICSRLRTQLNISIPLSVLYRYPTVSLLSKYLEEINNTSVLPKITEENKPTSMSEIQLVYLTQHLINPKNLKSRCLMSWIIKGDLKIKSLQRAIEYVHQHHEALRSSYVPDPVPTINVVDIGAPTLKILPGQKSIKAALHTLRIELSKNLDPLEGKIWRTAIVTIQNSNISIFGCSIHHIAFDGYSEHILSNDLTRGYNNAPQILEPTFPLFTKTLNPLLCENYTSQKDELHYKEFLITELKNTPEIKWPTFETKNKEEQSGCKEFSVFIDKDFLKKIDLFAKSIELSRFELLLHYWAKSLAFITKQYDFCIGVPVRQRSSIELETSIGCYINMICVRLREHIFKSELDGFKETSRIVQKAFEIQDIPYTQVLDLVNPKKTERPPLFQTLFALQDNPIPELQFDGLKTKFIRQPYLDLPLELHAEIWPTNTNGLRLIISYRSEIIQSATVKKLASIFLENLSLI